MRFSHALIATVLAAALSGPVMSAGVAQQHQKLGFDCSVCHGPNKKELAEPTMQTCRSCHASDALVAKTKNVKPTNPHTSPHYRADLDCTNCHMGHQESENFCNQCHEFKFKVP